MHARIRQRTPGKKKTGQSAPARPRFPFASIFLVLILVCGLGLRLRGLSHGLAEGEVYHPDTPRLMWASRQFLEGTYFFRVNHPDYDGYPYFYSHAVEYLWRGGRGLGSFFSHLLLGTDRSSQPLTVQRLTNILFWLARLTNVALSTLVILVVYRIAARNLGSTTGLVAAALIALSPLNIAMAHFATNDTMVTFFTTLTVLFALRICTAGVWLDYLLGGMLIACAFSAKYHGGIVGLTCLLGHVMRYWPARKLLSKEALSRLALMAVAFFIILLLANPCMLVSPGKAFHDFRKYCRYIPAAKLSAAQMQWGFFAKARLSLTRNFPILLRSTGLVIFIMAFVGLIHAFFRGKKLAVLASFPSLYLLFTFMSKPVQQRFYLAVPLPIMFLLAATFLVEIARIRKIRAATTTAAVAILFLGFFFLLKSSLKEAFFFSHRDTRKCAQQWANQNIPPSYRIEPGDYTFSLRRPRRAPSSYRGTVFLSSSLRPARPPEGSFLLKAFDLEEDALPTFRNPRIEIYAQASPLLSEGFVLPVYQRIPSESTNEFIFADGASFYQDEKMMEFGADRQLSKILVTSQPIDSAVAIVRNSSIPGSARVRLGGAARTFYLGPSGVRWKELKGLRQSFPSSPSRCFYKLSASATVSTAVLLVALTPEEKGVALFNIGEYAAAHPFLARASHRSSSPVLAAMAYLCGRLSMSPTSADEEKALLKKASLFNSDLNPETISSAFLISLDYLDSLPYLSMKPCKKYYRGFHLVPDISASADSAATEDVQPHNPETWLASSRALILEPGCYVATLRVRCEPSADPDATIKVCLMERGMKRVVAEKEFPVSSLPGGYTELQFPFEKPAEVGECWVVIRSDRHLPVFLDRIELRPDPLKTLIALQRLLRIAASPPDSLPLAGPLDYKALLLFGDQRLAQDQHRQALAYYLLAHQLRPDLAEPIRKIRRVERAYTAPTPEDSDRIGRILAGVQARMDAVEIGEASVAFGNGVKLTGYAMSRGPFRPGQRIAMSLYWSVARTRRLDKGLIVWMHFLDQRGEKAFQLDHYLSQDLSFPQKPERIIPILNHEAKIPADTPPGKYRIEIGLWIPLRDWRPPIASTSLPHTRYSTTIREIVIEPR